MKKILKTLIQSLVFSLPLYASNLVIFEPSSPVKAVDLNTNFDYVKNILQGRNIQMNFKSFQSGNVIKVEDFEEEFDKLRSLNISIDPLNLLQIKSAELNQAFSQMASGSLVVDDIPLSSNFNFSVDEDSQYIGTVSFSNQTGTSSLEIVSPPSKGTIVVGVEGNFSFSPFSNQNGSDSFTYRIYDGNSYSNIATASINIDPVNDIPVAIAQSGLTVLETGSLNITLAGTDLEGSSLTYSIVNQPSKAVLSGSGNSIVYTPNFNMSGADSFTFMVNDGEDNSLVATVSISITAVWPTGTEPALEVLAGNVDIPSGSEKNYSSIYIAAGATVTITGSNEITVLGSAGPVVIDGEIRTNSTSINTSTATKITPTGHSLSYTQTRTAGGNGGRGGSGQASGVGISGGTSVNGRGGGGAGAYGTSSGGRDGGHPPVPSGQQDTELGDGGNGGKGVSAVAGAAGKGGGQAGTRHPSNASASGGGGGGGGGYVGRHGLSLFIKTKHSITGSGTINLSGLNGYNGGNGGRSNYTAGTTSDCLASGGGGGGGSGGSGGNLWVISPIMSVSYNLNSGSGGLAGIAGGQTVCGNSALGYFGKNGSGGLAGIPGEYIPLTEP